jgi:hypothetical protein
MVDKDRESLRKVLRRAEALIIMMIMTCVIRRVCTIAVGLLRHFRDIKHHCHMADLFRQFLAPTLCTCWQVIPHTHYSPSWDCCLMQP